MYSALIFIHFQHLPLFKIEHLHLYSTVIFVHNIIIHLEIFYPFNNFYSYKIYYASLLHMEVAYFLQPIKRGSEEAKAIITGSLKRYRPRSRFIE